MKVTFDSIDEAVMMIVSFAHGSVRNADGTIGHYRKYTKDPYIKHLKEVRNIYAAAVPDDPVGNAIAFGHDLFEDTDFTPTDLVSWLTAHEFAPDVISEVVNGIIELTDVYTAKAAPDLNRAKRKEMEALRIAGISKRGKKIKLSDLISNTKDIVPYDKKFAPIYLEEKEYLLTFLKGANPMLYGQAVRELEKAKKKIIDNN